MDCVVTPTPRPFPVRGKESSLRKLFRRNLEILGRRFPAVAARVREAESHPDRSETEYTRNTPPNGCAPPTDPDPLVAARSYWARQELRNPGLVVFLGLDQGHRLKAFFESPRPNTHAVLAIERDVGLFSQLLRTVDLSGILQDPRLQLLVGVEEGDLGLALFEALGHHLAFTLIRATHIVAESRSYGRFQSYYRSALVALKDAAKQHLLLVGNDPNDSFIGTQHMLLNLETIAREPAIKDLFGCFPGRPAVIVATGPSLDASYRHLVGIEDRVVLFSVDASLKFLLAQGIRPHFVTSLERGPNVIRCFEGLEPEQCGSTVQVATPVVRPEVYEAYPGPKAILYRTIHHFKWLRNDKGTLDTGPSSANMAFRIAEALGCDPIILVGQDLAYGEDGSTHARAAPWGRSWSGLTPRATDTFYVKGNRAEKVLTNWQWNLFRQEFERAIAKYGGTVINTTQGGAFIAGAVRMSVEEAISRYARERFDPRGKIFNTLRRPAEEEASAYLQWIQSVHAPATVKALEVRAKEALEREARTREALESGRHLANMDELLAGNMAFIVSLFDDELLATAAGQTIQPRIIPALVEHHDLPNRLHHVERINKARLEAQGALLRDVGRMLFRLAELFRDPGGARPLDPLPTATEATDQIPHAP